MRPNLSPFLLNTINLPLFTQQFFPCNNYNTSCLLIPPTHMEQNNLCSTLLTGIFITNRVWDVLNLWFIPNIDLHLVDHYFAQTPPLNPSVSHHFRVYFLSPPAVVLSLPGHVLQAEAFNFPVTASELTPFKQANGTERGNYIGLE